MLHGEKRLNRVGESVGIPRVPLTSAKSGRNRLVLEWDLSLVEGLRRLVDSWRVEESDLAQVLWGILLYKYQLADEGVYPAVCWRKDDRPWKPTSEWSDHARLARISVGENSSVVECCRRLREEKHGWISVKASGLMGKESPLFVYEEGKGVLHPPQEDTSRSRGAEPDLWLHWVSDARVRLAVDYDCAVYDDDIARRLLGHLRRLAEQIVADPGMCVSEMELVTAEEKETLLFHWNGTEHPYPKNRTLHQLFREQLERTPDHAAVVFGDERVTYRELGERSDRLACWLREKGVKRGDVVGLLVDRSPMMITAILAVLKAGGAYLPIDPSTPPERTAFMLKDSRARLLLKDPHLETAFHYDGLLLDLIPETAFHSHESGWQDESQSDDVAYIMYTSGSTGKPKGILTTHRNVVRTVVNNGYVVMRDDDKVLQLSNYAFDGSTFDIYHALLNGAALVMVSQEDVLDFSRLSRLIVDEGVTVSFMTTALFNTLVDVDAACLAGLRKIFFGGEKVSPKHVEKALACLGENRLVHVYGPTETTVFATFHPVTDNDTACGIIPIGRPIHNTTVYVLDSGDRLQPVGIPGELCIGGDGLAKGYLNQPELDADKFVDHPFLPGEKLYRTGDLVRRLPDGAIQFLDRIDQQVKIRGHRIELGEIESRILEFPGVSKAAVTARTDEQGHSHLCAYVVSDGEWTVDQLNRHLSKALPAYMIPTHYVGLDVLPLTPNGKVDRRALPLPSARSESVVTEAPATETEKRLLQLWQEVLGIDRIGIRDPFFEVGGHSLKAALLLSRIRREWNVELPLSALFEHSTVERLARYIDEAEQVGLESIPRVAPGGSYPVSSAQKRLYAVQQWDVTSTSYHTPFLYEITGPLFIEGLQTVFRTLIDRHEALRTSFHYENGELRQRVHDRVRWDLERLEADTQSLEATARSFIRPFRLDRAPLFRVGLIRLGPNRHVLLMDMHHIISDGLSVALLNREISRLAAGETLPSLPFQYKDYAVWQRRLLAEGKMAEQEAYWKGNLAGELPVLELPTDRPRPPVQSFDGERMTREWDRAETESLRAFARKQGVTPFMVLLAGYYWLLSKISGQEDIIVGTPHMGRSHPDLESIFGMFVNTLPLRQGTQQDQPFHGFLQQVKKRVLEAFQHGDYPLEEMIDSLDMHRDPSRNPLFDTLFIMQNMDLPDPIFPGTQVRACDPPWQGAKADLAWEVFDRDAIHIRVEYNTDLFDRETVQRLLRHYRHVMQQLIADSALTLAEVELLTEKEKERILEAFNDTCTDYPAARTLHEWFEMQAANTPDRVAVEGEEEEWTYRILNERANQLARVLRDKGVGRDHFVNLMVDRSVSMLVGMLAILKAGGAYVPIDPDLPSRRIEALLEETESPLLLTQSHLNVPPGYGGEVMVIDDNRWFRGEGSNLKSVSGSGDLAYMIFTSGSTGKPKGVMVEHQGVCNIVQLMRQNGIARPGGRQLQFYSVSFDASILDMFPSLLSGATLVLTKKEMLLSPDFLDWLDRKRITNAGLMPSVLRSLPYRDLPHLESILVGGEPLTADVVDPWARDQLFINMYGPTEATVTATQMFCRPGMDRIPIGKPILNKRVYILNEQDQPQPIGVPGELCISGVGIARGYWKRPALTREKFVPDPFRQGLRMYKTGDRARWLSDGTIEFLGRMDDQVKIRGHRVELDEVTGRLLEHPQVKEGIVIDRRDGGDPYLCAYAVLEEGADGSDVRTHLAEVLPGYMVPSHVVRLARLPLTANNKVDRRALPLPDPSAEAKQTKQPPRNRVEQILAEVWTEVLKTDEVGIHDHFLEWGGDSIKGIQIAAKLNARGLKLDTKDLYRYPTIYELAPHVKEADAPTNQGPVVGEVPLTPIQQWFFDTQTQDPHHWNQAMMGYHPAGWEEQAVQRVLSALVQHHDALRMRYRREKNRVIQTNLPVAGNHVSLETFDWTGNRNAAALMEREAERMQASLDLEQGPLMRAGLFRTGEGDHLLLIIHHLVVDGVSWRILLEDFQTGYEQVLQGKEIRFPEKTSSVQEWSRRLRQMAHEKSPLAEISYWRSLEERKVAGIPKDREGPDPCERRETEVESVSLDAETTRLLLTEAHRAYRTEITDLLLAALVSVVKEWTDGETVAIQMEGHGREEIIDGVDLSRTVGWFTSTYPVLFSCREHGIDQMIKSVKETLRRVPNKGIGYGILRYLAPESARSSMKFSLCPSIGFNYLGQYDAGPWQVAGVGVAPLPSGDPMGPRSWMPVPLDINGMVLEGTMRFAFRYNRKILHRETIKRLAERFKSQLTNVVRHCTAKTETEYTPSDFSANDIQMDELEQFLESLK
ncbi:non-ribosomal peptide synthetase [Desmospora profundinema]|uniref:Amino acid adenylation domain-containing protein/non-ribosomal peptide synthase protein (TIGR01720 family) n=1 Tax=Desmospora profundinema TaxID=1571184 RepID=A0ABU1IQ95_9BACL|nr:non-ribosomal peptide synthetase [Desmospora profundinema]MDR6226881.1 amino acid adenylation domain-containing protein/non-ribosomal peptide synthase protein (TIGR01720 family) [Desmospora profundinema]